MKRYFLVGMMAMLAVVGMAQHHGDKGPHGGHHHKGHAPHQEARYIPCATPNQAMMVLRVLEDLSFDDKKLEVAKLSVSLAPFEVRDLARIAAAFSFDDKRKEFLIYAYDTCCDPENYYLLRECFSFRSNFDEMMETVLPGYRR